MSRISREEGFGVVLIVLHWTMAALIITLFFMGRYMTGLEYTHPLYHRVPDLHKGLGLLVMGLLVLRTIWAIMIGRPAPLPMTAWERTLAMVVQKSFYFILFGITISGYLIPTARGRGIELFGWFTVPALFTGLPHQEDMAGDLHYLLAHLLMLVLALHTMGALKHHFLDRDDTLLRMLGMRKKKKGGLA